MSSSFRYLAHDVAESRKRLVDCLGFFESFSICITLLDPLRAREVYKRELTYIHRPCRLVGHGHLELHHEVRSRGVLIEIRLANSTILKTDRYLLVHLRVTCDWHCL